MAMTALDKAEAALAAFRGEVECPNCHRYVDRRSMNTWPKAECIECWYDDLDAIEKRNAVVSGLYEPA